MFKRLLALITVLNLLSFNALAMNINNPFAKNENLVIGKDVGWKIDSAKVLAIKTAVDKNGDYYHLQFDNKQLKLFISSDANGASPKKLNRLEIKDVVIDGKQNPLFRWCLNNQEGHKRYLQQGLKVKKNVCSIKGNAGTFTMRLDKDTLESLKKGDSLEIKIKPFRTVLVLNYDLVDFNKMYQALNFRAKVVAVAEKHAATVSAQADSSPHRPSVPKKICKLDPPPNYKTINSVEYICDDAAAKKDAEAKLAKQLDQENARQQKLAAEQIKLLAAEQARLIEKQREVEQQRKQKEQKEQKELKELAEKLKQEELLQAEAVAIAASEANQAQINNEITQKMLKVCDKYWNKGEHRCYCQKYIEHAPSVIQASSTCQ
jgi:flagellar biosynthesis GTPase FlhF